MSVSNWSMDTPSLVNSGALTPYVDSSLVQHFPSDIHSINFDMFKTYELDVPNYTNSQKALVASHDICSTDNTTDWPLMFPGVSSQSDVAYPKASMCACGLEQSSASYSDPTGTASMPPTEEISGGEADMTSKKNTKPTIEGQIAPDNWKAGGGIRETEPLRKSSGRFFETYEEAMAEVKGPAWKAPKHDAVPTSDAELAPFVDKLMVAMLSLENIVDSASTTMKNRFFDENWVEGDSQTSITNPYYPKHMLEKLAWQLVVSSSFSLSFTTTYMNPEAMPDLASTRTGFHVLLGPSHLGRVLRGCPLHISRTYRRDWKRAATFKEPGKKSSARQPPRRVLARP
jgi:hypothetical protein